jgi:LPXTG-motif cell wall-anchored protein
VTAVSYGYSSTAIKTVTELNTDLSETTNQTNSESGTNYIVLSRDTDSMFRYGLSMNNTGGSSGAMAISKYVLVDNLPQVGDHTTLSSEYARYSEFQVDFADPEQLQFEVAVTTNGVKKVLEASEYSLQFSKQTEFDYTGTTNAVWDGDTLTAADGWYTLAECTADGTLGQMRSVRVVIDDTSLTGLMPGGAKITVGFNAMVDPGANPDYSAIAWNSFAYRYTVVNNGTMQAAPLKVGVKLKGIPHLQKSLLDENGKSYTATGDMTFQFLIYAGKSQGFDSSTTDEAKMRQLTEANIPFTIANITVKAGTTQSEQLALDSLKLWTYDGAAKEETENWTWTDGNAYTVTELLGDGTGDFALSSLGGKRSNSYTFTYHDSASLNIRGVNQRKSWGLLVHTTDEPGTLSLENAVFGLYSKDRPTTAAVISDSAKKLLIGSAPQTYVDAAGTTWYLTAVQATGSSGQTEFTKLVEDTYLLRELQAPSGYVIKTAAQQVKEPKTRTGTREVTVTNTFMTVPTGILENTSGLLAIGLLLLGACGLWLLKKRRLQ